MNYSKINAIKSPIKRKTYVERAYLDYWDNFLTVSRFAEYMECTESEARELIKEGRQWHNLPKNERVVK